MDTRDDGIVIPIITSDYTTLLSRPRPRSIQRMQVQIDTDIVSPSSLWKIWDAIQKNVILTDQDVLLDWGCATGIMLASKQFFSPFPHMRSIGVEMRRHIFEKSILTLRSLGITNTQIILGDSSSVQSWDPATIVLHYDGESLGQDATYRTIISKLFRSQSIRVVFTFRLNIALFRAYFEASDVVDIQKWRVVRIHGLTVQKSKRRVGYLWVRISY
jgi:precorrin-6B methylase 2